MKNCPERSFFHDGYRTGQVNIMRDTVLIVPGYKGSGAAHWQTWLEASLPDARRVRGIDWDSPVLPEWTAAIHREIDTADGKVWIVAHSFGCLASAVVVSERAEKVAGVIFVAPADPERFSPSGVRQRALDSFSEASITSLVPHGSLDTVNNIVVASENDPWLALNQACLWARRWGSKLVNIGPAGHINTESGFGPWPWVMDLLSGFRHAEVIGPARPRASAISLTQKGLRWSALNFAW